MNLNKLLNYQSNNNENLSLALGSYYSIDNYNFVNDDQIREYIYDRFNQSDRELFILDKEFILNNQEQILASNNGIILFDLSMTNDEQLYTNIHMLSTNYKNINLHLIEDNYIIEYDTKEPNQLIDKNQLEMNLKNLFSDDLQKLLLKQRINNIPNIIQNDRFTEKIAEDLSFSNINSYQNILSENSIKKYKQDLKLNLNSSDYRVIYMFEDEIKNIDKALYDKILEKLKEFNTYIDDIVIQLNSLNNPDKIIKLDKNNQDKTISDKQISLKNLFERNKLNTLYTNNKSNIQIEMSDVLDQTFSINSIDNKLMSEDNFYNNMIRFLNELIKRKINKIIKLNNYLQLINNI